MKKYLFFFTFLLLTIELCAQSVAVNRKWLEFNVTQNGIKGIKIHVDFNIKDMKGKQGKVIIYFEHPKGTGLKDTNENYRTSNGDVCVSEKFTPSYDNSHYKDFDVFMPIDEIHMKKGEFTYYCDIRIQNTSSGKFLNGETYLSFSGTSQGEQSGEPYSNRSNRTYNSSSSEQTWRESLRYGMFAINKGDPNGVRQRTIWRACSACRGTSICQNCHGTGRCTICNGQGGIITVGYGSYIPCMACGQSGKCGVCHGTGKCICTKYDYPGYMPGSSMIVDANGHIIANSSDYSSGSSSSSSESSSHSSRGICPKCSGRKYESTAYDYATTSASGWAQPYHNYGGSSCPYCNSKTDHYHYPCSECRGFGHN